MAEVRGIRFFATVGIGEGAERVGSARGVGVGRSSGVTDTEATGSSVGSGVGCPGRKKSRTPTTRMPMATKAARGKASCPKAERGFFLL